MSHILYLNSAGPDPLATMAVVRSLYHLSLGESRRLIADCPVSLPATPAGLSEEDVKQRFAVAGAEVGDSPVAAKPASEPEPESESESAPAPAPATEWMAATTSVAEEPAEPAKVGGFDLSGFESLYDQPAAPASRLHIAWRSCGEYKLRVTKIISAITGLRLAPAKEWADSCHRSHEMDAGQAEQLKAELAELGIKAVTGLTSFVLDTPPEPVTTQAAGAGGSAVAENTVYAAFRKVGLVKLQLVKIVKEATGWGLKEAKEWVDEDQGLRRITASQAEAIRREAAGIGAELVVADKPFTLAAPSDEARICITGFNSRSTALFVIKMRMGYNSAQAKDVLDHLPADLPAMPRDQAEHLGKEFLAQGISCEIHDSF